MRFIDHLSAVDYKHFARLEKCKLHAQFKKKIDNPHKRIAVDQKVTSHPPTEQF